jgi:hypothetical protein
MMATQGAQNSMPHLILGGATLQRCDNSILWTVALAPEVRLAAVATTPREHP